jgi:DNA-binding PadR family transcriptional regulator
MSFRPPPDDEPKDKACFGRGFLFGRHHGGPFARRSGARLFDSGALRLLVLGLIAEAPRHGYDLIKGLKARFAGAYSPSPGSIYPILQTLAEAGLVEAQAWGPRRRFSITEAGLDYLQDHAAELARIKAQVEQAAAPVSEASGGATLGDLARELREVLLARLRPGALTPPQVEKLKDILRRARQEIDRL